MKKFCTYYFKSSKNVAYIYIDIYIVFFCITYIAIYKMISFLKMLKEKNVMSFLIIDRENKIQYSNFE